MKKNIILSFFTGTALAAIASGNPAWLEKDSVSAIQYRISSDFSLPLDSGIAKIQNLYPQFDITNIRECIDNHYLETMIINGVERMHRKSPSNFKLLCPQLRGEWQGRGGNPDKEDIEMVTEIVSNSNGNGSISNGKLIKYRFSIEVPVHDFLIGDTLKVWLPVPIESTRQKNIKITNVSHRGYILSKGSGSEHNTMYIEHPVTEPAGNVIKFEYEGEYETYAQYFSPQYIKNNIKPYNKDSELYQKYTQTTHKHIINCDSLALAIVGNEKCPFNQSELVYNYISATFPWAGAREYSTIESLPQYVLDERHGDCGQVALLYISLMRSLGIPAKWESGWMLHPWSENLHDWAEVYFEGVGWVPVDVSFGRYVNSGDERITNFFSTGMDNYRFASNTGICSPLYPVKKYTRSETVDFQVGEVECCKGNLFYPGWKKKLDVISITDL